MKNIILTLLFCFIAANAFSFSVSVDTTTGSTTYSYDDTWVNWPGPGYNTSTLGDENGTPKIDSMDVVVSGTGMLQSVNILLHDSTYRQAYDSLFINSYNETTTNTAWDDWDYFVHDGGSSHAGDSYNVGTVAGDGFYSVDSDFDYTYVKGGNRIDNPNGIDFYSLTSVDSTFGGAHANGPYTSDGYVSGDFFILYDLASFNIDVSDGFFVAYTPWCDNDIIGGGTEPVPEPATLILLGSGLAGLAFYRRKKK